MTNDIWKIYLLPPASRLLPPASTYLRLLTICSILVVTAAGRARSADHSKRWDGRNLQNQLMEMDVSSDCTWCHQSAGRYKTSPGSSVKLTGFACANFGNFRRSGCTMSTRLRYEYRESIGKG